MNFAFLKRGQTWCALVASAFIGLGIGKAVEERQPVGKVAGKILFEDRRGELDGIEVILNSDSGNEIFRTRTRPDGTFAFAQIPTNSYSVSASTRAHRADTSSLSVYENERTDVTLTMERSESSFELKQHQKVFGTRESVVLPMSGYVDGKKPAGQDKVRVRVYQTRFSNVMKNAKATEDLERVGRSYDSPKAIPASLRSKTLGIKTLRDEQIKITEDDREGFFYKNHSFGKLTNGLYLVDLQHGKDSACAWLLVTDTAIVTKKAGSQLLAYVVEMKSGKPIANAEVQVFHSGTVRASAKTNRNGLAELRVSSGSASRSNTDEEGEENGGSYGNGERLTTVVRYGKDESVVNLNDYYNEGRGRFVVEAYTDRPIYRPGQKISFKGIARRKQKPKYASPLADKPGLDTIAYQYSVPMGQIVDVELRDPSGERVLKQRYTANRYGSFFGSVELLPEATTGVYSLIMQTDGETHTHDIVIASYQKPEFQVEVSTDKPRYIKGEPMTAKVKGTYYFGGALAGAKAYYTIMKQPDWAVYDEPEEEYESDYEDSGEYVNSGEIVLDENGEAKIEIPSEEPKDENDKSKPIDTGYVQTEKYLVSVEVTDQSDRMVSGEASVKVVPGDFRLSIQTEGYVAEPNKPTSLTLIATDYDDKPVANQTVTTQLSYEEWKHDQYVTEKGALITSTTDAAGRTTVTISPPKSGYLVFTSSAKDRAGRTITAMRSLWVVSDNGGDLQTEYSDLSILTDKKGYAPGETARVLINANKPNLTVLLTVEGDRVAYQQVVAMTGRSTVVRVPMRAEFGPNVVLAACYVSNKKIAQSEAALRVSLPDKEIKVAIEADRSPASGTEGALARYQPGEAITYTVKTTDKNGNPLPCEVSFGVVDEAIYALREDSPNALRNAFYPRRYNQVTTNYSFAIEYLGDADKAEPQIAARKKFPDTAYWNPTLTTDANGMATVRFNLPDNLTTWRATAVAHTLDTRLGRSTQKVMVNKDFFVRLEKPRFLTVKDESIISAIVHNNTETPQNAQVRLIVGGVKLQTAETQSATVAPGKTAEIAWNITASSAGTQNIRLTAWTPKGDGTQYTDGIETTIPIKPHGREMITGLSGQITDTPQTEVVRFDANAAPENSYVTIRVTPSLIGALANGVEYLVGYPYGCTEQTTSRILPDLVIQRLMRKNGFTLSHSQAELSRMVRSGLARLIQLQNKETGQWGWWENDKADLWMTAYALYGIATAKQEGYQINPNLLKTATEGAKKSLAAVQENLDRPSSKDSKRANYVTEQEKIRVFLLYSLAQLGETALVRQYYPNLRAVRLERMDAEGLAYLILLNDRMAVVNPYAYDRRSDDDPNPAALLDKKLIAANGMMHWNSGVEADAMGTGSDLTATAMGLRALLTIDRNDARIPAILRWLMYKRTDNYWASTRDTAWILMALAEYLQNKSALSANGTLSLSLNGSLLQTIALDGKLGKEKELVIRVPASKLRPDKNEFQFSRDGGSVPVFYTVESRQTIQQDEIPALSMAGIQVKREYLRLLSPQKGDITYKERTEATNNQLTVGDKIRVRLTLTVPSDMAYVLIEDPFPSGCETMERGDASEVEEDWKYWYDAINVRDDRIAFFIRTLPKGTHTLEYNLRAQTAGQCGALPTLLQAMYVPELKAESHSAHLTIEGAKP